MYIPSWPQFSHLLTVTSSKKNAPCQRCLKLVSWTWQLVPCSSVAFPVTGPKTSRTPLGCGRTGDSRRGCEADKSAEITWCNRTSVILKGMLKMFCGVHAHKELGLFWGKKEALSSSVSSLCICPLTCNVFKHMKYWFATGLHKINSGHANECITHASDKKPRKNEEKNNTAVFYLCRYLKTPASSCDNRLDLNLLLLIMINSPSWHH